MSCDSAATPWRRVSVLFACGAIAGRRWWAVYRYGARLVGIRKAVEPGAPPIPGAAATAHTHVPLSTAIGAESGTVE